MMEYLEMCAIERKEYHEYMDAVRSYVNINQSARENHARLIKEGVMPSHTLSVSDVRELIEEAREIAEEDAASL